MRLSSPTEAGRGGFGRTGQSPADSPQEGPSFQTCAPSIHFLFSNDSMLLIFFPKKNNFAIEILAIPPGKILAETVAGENP